MIPGIAGGLAISGSTLFVHGGGRNLAALSLEDGLFYGRKNSNCHFVVGRQFMQNAH